MPNKRSPDKEAINCYLPRVFVNRVRAAVDAINAAKKPNEPQETLTSFLASALAEKLERGN